MRNYQEEFDRRVAFIIDTVAGAHASGIIYGNSGGKDCTLVGILCKAACDNTVGIIMPCSSSRNYGRDKDDALVVAEKYGIETRIVDLTPLKNCAVETIGAAAEISPMAGANINPRLRMITLYTVGQSENRLVAGTGNRSEATMGYFTKWGDGAYDFNPIADLTVKEIFEFLEFLGAPRCIIDKAPSAALFEGQTDEQEMGITYASIDSYLLEGKAHSEADTELIERRYNATAHKRRMPLTYLDYKG